MSSSSIIEAGIAQLNLGSTMPECPRKRLEKYHHAYACLSKPSRPPEGHEDRNMIYHNLLQGGIGASLVPDTKTISCPFGDVQSLESPKAVKGFDTTWIVENTSAKDVVLAWIVDGFEYSPFHPDLNPMEDYRAILRPGGELEVPLRKYRVDPRQIVRGQQIVALCVRTIDRSVCTDVLPLLPSLLL